MIVGLQENIVGLREKLLKQKQENSFIITAKPMKFPDDVVHKIQGA